MIHEGISTQHFCTNSPNTVLRYVSPVIFSSSATVQLLQTELGFFRQTALFYPRPDCDDNTALQAPQKRKEIYTVATADIQ